MIKREDISENDLNKLEDAVAFKNIQHMPARVKCALLAWHTFEKISDDLEANNVKDGIIQTSITNDHCCDNKNIY